MKPYSHKNHYQVIGLMSGTSMDGLDMAYCEFTIKEGHWHFKIPCTETKSYEPEWQKLLQEITMVDGFKLTESDFQLGRWMGKAVREFIDNNGLSPDFIASHGHTVFHQPEKGITLQIGNGFALHQATGLPVVNSFRNLDVALGGQGAPLVPVGDRFLFNEYDACLNLGGIANISAETPQGRIAYDICPANMVLNYLANYLEYAHDPEGSLAASGKISHALLEQLDQLDFYHKPYPKSLGYEWVADNIFPVIDNSALSLHDLLATFTHHIAQQVAGSIHELIPVNGHNKILITGGGGFNDYLITCIQEYAGNQVKLILPEKDIILYKEALIFALLGTLKVRNEVNCLSTVTGCAYDHSGGVIFGNF